MDNSKGSLILKALSPSADEAQRISFRGRRAKSIPALLQTLPAVLSRRGAEDTGLLVIDCKNWGPLLTPSTRWPPPVIPPTAVS